MRELISENKQGNSDMRVQVGAIGALQVRLLLFRFGGEDMCIINKCTITGGGGGGGGELKKI